MGNKMIVKVILVHNSCTNHEVSTYNSNTGHWTIKSKTWQNWNWYVELYNNKAKRDKCIMSPYKPVTFSVLYSSAFQFHNNFDSLTKWQSFYCQIYFWYSKVLTVLYSVALCLSPFVKWRSDIWIL